MTAEACTPFAFQWGAWSTVLFGAALLLGAYIRAKWRSVQALPGAGSARAQLELTLEEEAMEQLSFAEAMEAKTEVLGDMAERHEGWMALALAKFHEMRDRLPPDFLGEDIRRVLTEAGLPQPRSAKVWGAFVNWLGRNKLIVATGQCRAMQAKGSNGRQSRVYRAAVLA